MGVGGGEEGGGKIKGAGYRPSITKGTLGHFQWKESLFTCKSHLETQQIRGGSVSGMQSMLTMLGRFPPLDSGKLSPGELWQ